MGKKVRKLSSAEYVAIVDEDYRISVVKPELFLSVFQRVEKKYSYLFLGPN